MQPEKNINDRLGALIEALGKSPSSFSSQIGVAATVVYNMVAGRRSKPSFEVLEKIINTVPDLNLSWLIKGQGPMFNSVSPIPQGTNTFRTSPEAVQVVVATQDTHGNATIPMINRKAAANYLSGFQSQEFFEELDPIVLPNYMLKPGQHFLLQVTGDSMETTFHDGDWVLCRYVERPQWFNIRDFDCYVLVSQDRGMQLKRIKNRLQEHGFIRCRSDNRAHTPFNLAYEEIVEIWHVEWKLSAYFPNLNEDLYKKMAFLEEDIQDLKEMVTGLKRYPLGK
jgi:phage repressor protein C with HTH and peptisase S24 domain